MRDFATTSARQPTAREPGLQPEVTRTAQSTVERADIRLRGLRQQEPFVTLGGCHMRVDERARGLVGATG